MQILHDRLYDLETYDAFGLLSHHLFHELMYHKFIL